MALGCSNDSPPISGKPVLPRSRSRIITTVNSIRWSSDQSHRTVCSKICPVADESSQDRTLQRSKAAHFQVFVLVPRLPYGLASYLAKSVKKSVALWFPESVTAI
jgi:hypothetical protein